MTANESAFLRMEVRFWPPDADRTGVYNPVVSSSNCDTHPQRSLFEERRNALGDQAHMLRRG